MTLIILIIPFWVSVVIAVRAQIGESTIFHWTCFHEWQFYAKALNLIQLKFLIIKIFAKKIPWLLWKSKTKYLNWAFASSNIQRTERLLNFVQSIEWIVNIKEITNIEWVPILKDFSKNVWSVFFGKNTSQFWPARYL